MCVGGGGGGGREGGERVLLLLFLFFSFSLFLLRLLSVKIFASALIIESYKVNM